MKYASLFLICAVPFLAATGDPAGPAGTAVVPRAVDVPDATGTAATADAAISLSRDCGSLAAGPQGDSDALLMTPDAAPGTEMASGVCCVDFLGLCLCSADSTYNCCLRCGSHCRQPPDDNPYPRPKPKN